jgi:hypothetical protein
VASTATPVSAMTLVESARLLTDLRQAELNPYFTGSVRAVASGARFLSAPEAPLRATALSLSHLTWSLCTPTTAFRTCHPTTSFPVLIADYPLSNFVSMISQPPLARGSKFRKAGQ